MPKASLSFMLPDENGEFHAAIHGQEFASALHDIDQHCRSMIKYGSLTEDEAALLQEIRNMIPLEATES